MGKGNTLIKYNDCYPETYYISYPGEDEMEQEDEYFYSDFIETISSILNDLKLSNSFCNTSIRASYNYDINVLFKTDNCVILTADNEWSLALAIALNDDNIEDLSENEIKKLENNYKEEANIIMKELTDIYQLYQRTSAWTSSKITSSKFIFYK